MEASFKWMNNTKALNKGLKILMPCSICTGAIQMIFGLEYQLKRCISDGSDVLFNESHPFTCEITYR